ncbi:MAG: hypothetical protein KKA64_03705 [Nanoarchaeota archaeon]|nr:hypothetical protein [Nanoarchaeota archaeon]
MTPKEAKIKYGRKMFNKMQRSGELNGITVCLNKKGGNRYSFKRLRERL